MKDMKCESCPLRQKYEVNPKSLLGKLWRWHLNFCPGWYAYFQSVDEQTKIELRQKYQLTKKKFNK